MPKSDAQAYENHPVYCPCFYLLKSPYIGGILSTFAADFRAYDWSAKEPELEVDFLEDAWRCISTLFAGLGYAGAGTQAFCAQ